MIATPEYIFHKESTELSLDRLPPGFQGQETFRITWAADSTGLVSTVFLVKGSLERVPTWLFVEPKINEGVSFTKGSCDLLNILMQEEPDIDFNYLLIMECLEGKEYFADYHKPRLLRGKVFKTLMLPGPWTNPTLQG